jgi:hypothetical protein
MELPKMQDMPDTSKAAIARLNESLHPAPSPAPVVIAPMPTADLWPAVDMMAEVGVDPTPWARLATGPITPGILADAKAAAIATLAKRKALGLNKPPRITPQQGRLLELLSQHKAFDENSMVKTEQLDTEEYADHADGNFKRAVSSMNKAGYVKTIKGAGGGVYLTSSGKERAESESRLKR